METPNARRGSDQRDPVDRQHHERGVSRDILRARGGFRDNTAVRAAAVALRQARNLAAGVFSALAVTCRRLRAHTRRGRGQKGRHGDDAEKLTQTWEHDEKHYSICRASSNGACLTLNRGRRGSKNATAR